ncbi:sugar phosphate isomerase/epimerase family protein, partial [Sedimenticola sp.]|uniref:sugar phosphate isomerase/epimerase family protein n=1 Tax=Sedimenticola sp. TaxID=1940285 RepID=UPI003D0C5B50
VVPPLLDDPALFQRVKEAIRDTGVGVADSEMVRIGPTTDVESFRPFLARSAELGARHILVAMDDTDTSRRIVTYAELCELAASYQLSADLEFMPWTALRSIPETLDIIEASGQDNAAILVDTLHFDRCGCTLEQLASLPASRMNYVQLCDGPKEYDRSDEELIRIARTARLIPGDGGIDFPGICARLPTSVTISVEIPNLPQAERMGKAEFARAALNACERYLGEAD